MRRSSVFLATLLFAFTLSAQIEPPKADEKWITFETEGFRFISNDSPEVTQEIARNLLRMRAAIGQITRLTVQTLVPTNVYIFAGEDTFGPYRDAAFGLKDGPFSGAFVRRPGGSFIILRSGGDRAVYHELTHQFMANTTRGLPLWFVEGIAEYYSTFAIVDDAAHIGRPVHDHVLRLRDQGLIPLRELFAVTHSSPMYNEGEHTGRFYGQSWALVHYLMADPDRRAQFDRFLELLRGGKSVDEASSGAFRMQVSELEEALRTYIGRVSFNYNSYKLRGLAIAELPEPVAMPHDDLLQHLGQLVTTFDARHAATAKRFFDEALTVNPKNAIAYTGLGRVYDATGREKDADAAYAKAVKLGSRDAEIHLATGWSLWARRPNPDSNGRVRTSFLRATALEPKSSRAWAALGSLYMESETDRRDAILAFQKSVKLDPANEEAASHLVQLLKRERRSDDASKLEDALLARWQRRSAGSQATVMTDEVMTDEVDRFEQATALPDSFFQAMTDAYAGKHDEALAILDGLLPTIQDPAIEKQVREFREEVAGMKEKKKTKKKTKK